MSSKKLKEWKPAVERRLSELEHALRIRSSKPQHTTDTSAQEVQGHQEVPSKSTIRKRLTTILKYFGIAISLVATPLGIVTGYLSLVPKVTIVESESLVPLEPFTAQFIISNEGPLGINSVGTVCNVSVVRYKDLPSWDISNNKIATPEMFKARMEVGERGTMECPFYKVINTNAPIIYAEVSMSVDFRPDFTWSHGQRTYRFVTKPDSSGRLHWFPQPLNSQ
jgi:hypothetical protein